MTEDGRSEKVRKLLAKADRAGTPEEAEAFYAKAHELMTKWALDEAVLRMTDPSRFEFKDAAVVIKTTYKQSDMQLAQQVAKACGCECFVSTHYNGVTDFHFFGEAGDVDQALFLYASLQMQSASLARRQKQPVWEDCSPYVFRRSFRLGFAITVGERLQKARESTIKTATDANPGLLPVIISDEEKVLNEFEERHPNLRTRQTRAIDISGHGMDAGSRAGHGADIGNARVGSGRKELA